MLGAALADGSAQRRCTFEVFGRRLPDGRRFGVVAGTGPAARRRSGTSASPPTSWTALRGRRRGRRAAPPSYLAEYRFTGDIDGYAEGEPYFPHSPDAERDRQLRRGGGAGDPDAVGAQPRLRRSPPRPPGWWWPPATGRSSRWAPGAPTSRRRWPAPGPPTWSASQPPRTWRPGPGTACRPPAPPRTPSPCCTTARRPPSPPRSPRWASAPPCWSTPTTSRQGIETAIEVAGPGLGAIRIDSGDLAVIARQVPRPARLARRHRHPDRGQRRPGRVRDRRAGRRTGRRLRGRHRGGGRLRGADRRPGLQAGRGGRPAGGQAQREQGQRRRRQARPTGGTGPRARPPRRLVVQRRPASHPSRPGPAADVPVLRQGKPVQPSDLATAREQHRAAMAALPWEALKLSRGEPGLPVTVR